MTWYEEEKRTSLQICFVLTFQGSVHIQTLDFGSWTTFNKQNTRRLKRDAIMLLAWTSITFFIHTDRHQTLQSLQECLSPKSVSLIILRHECAYYKNALRNCCTLEWKGDTCYSARNLYQQNVQNNYSLCADGLLGRGQRSLALILSWEFRCV